MVTSHRHTQTSSFQANPSSLPTLDVMRGKISASSSLLLQKKERKKKKFTHPVVATSSVSLLFKCVPLFPSECGHVVHLVHLVLWWTEHMQEAGRMGGELQQQMQGGEIFEWLRAQMSGLEWAVFWENLLAAPFFSLTLENSEKQQHKSSLQTNVLYSICN